MTALDISSIRWQTHEPGQLRDVRRLVPDPFQIGNHLQRRGDLPQVPCHGLLLQQQLQAEVLHLPLLLVDLPLRLPGGACQVLVTLHQGLGRGRDGILTQGAHLDHFHVQPLQLLAKSVSHLTSLLSRTGR